MSDLVGNPEDRFSRVEAHIIFCLKENGTLYVKEWGRGLEWSDTF